MRTHTNLTGYRPGPQGPIVGQPVPSFLAPLKDDLRRNGVRVDLDKLAEVIRADEATPISADWPASSERHELRRRRARRDLFNRAADNLGYYRTDRLSVSPKSHALTNEAMPFPDHDKVSGHFLPIAGSALVDIEVETSPWRVLAHRAGDARLAAAVESGDVYSHLATELDGPRAIVKQDLFITLFSGSTARLQEAIDQAPDPAATEKLIARLRDRLAPTYSYMENRHQYRIHPRTIQAAANRVAGRAHAEAHRLVSEAGLGHAALLLDQGSVLYEMPTGKVPALQDLLRDAHVHTDGVRSPISAHVHGLCESTPTAQGPA